MNTFRQIYECHAKDVHRYACWLSGNAYDADDITSETFARAWAGRAKIRTETVKAYLFTIARNVYLKSFRGKVRHIELSDSTIDPAPTPAQKAEKRLMFEHTMLALQSLPEGYRTPLLLRGQQELSYEEIARVMQLPVATVKIRIYRARLKLAALEIGDEA